MWEMWDVTPVTHERTDERTVESRAVFSLSEISNKDLCKNLWYVLNPRVRCAFGNVSNMFRKSQKRVIISRTLSRLHNQVRSRGQAHVSDCGGAGWRQWIFCRGFYLTNYCLFSSFRCPNRAIASFTVADLWKNTNKFGVCWRKQTYTKISKCCPFLDFSGSMATVHF